MYTDRHHHQDSEKRVKKAYQEKQRRILFTERQRAELDISDDEKAGNRKPEQIEIMQRAPMGIGLE